MAGTAGAEVTVERKVFGRQLGEGKTGFGIGETKGEVVGLVVVGLRRLDENGDSVFGKLLGQLEGVGESAADVLANDESVDHNLN